MGFDLLVVPALRTFPPISRTHITATNQSRTVSGVLLGMSPLNKQAFLFMAEDLSITGNRWKYFRIG
jgi:hypothetical protein